MNESRRQELLKNKEFLDELMITVCMIAGLISKTFDKVGEVFSIIRRINHRIQNITNDYQIKTEDIHVFIDHIDIKDKGIQKVVKAADKEYKKLRKGELEIC